MARHWLELADALLRRRWLCEDGHCHVEGRASARWREAEHFTSFPSLSGVITEMNVQACVANGSHTLY